VYHKHCPIIGDERSRLDDPIALETFHDLLSLQHTRGVEAWRCTHLESVVKKDSRSFSHLKLDTNKLRYVTASEKD